MLGILLIPFVTASKYKPVPPTRIGIFFFFKHNLIFSFAKDNQAPVEKCFFEDINPYR